MTRSATGLVAGALLLSALIAPTTFAAAPNPSQGSATVDGDIGDWSLGDDFFADMTDAGNPDMPARAKLYLRYDCDSETLFALVLAVGDEKARQDRPDEAYLRIDGAGKLIDPDGDFAWVNGDGTLADGWEGAAELAPGSYTVRAHVLIADDSEDGYTPMDPVGRNVPLVIECEEEVEPTPTEEVAPTQGTNPTPKPPSGDVAPTTRTNPQTTLPPTDTLEQSTGAQSGGVALVLTLLALSSAASLVVTIGHRRRPAAVTVEETTESE